MVTLELALQILTMIPPLQFGTPAAAPIAPPQGTGTLLIAACQPGQGILIKGSAITNDITGTAGPDGIARINVPAQLPDADSYQINTAAGTARIHGTISAGETLSGVCP